MEAEGGSLSRGPMQDQMQDRTQDQMEANRNHARRREATVR